MFWETDGVKQNYQFPSHFLHQFPGLQCSWVAWLGDADAQAAYLEHFRADSIVRDCEAVTAAVVGAQRRVLEFCSFVTREFLVRCEVL